MPSIIFICTGNTCRSPMAEYILKKLLSEKEKEKWQIKSAGIAAMDGNLISSNALKVLKEKRIDASSHRSKSLSKIQLDSADLIITMTSAHKKILIDMNKELEDKTFTLKEFADYENNNDIEDPFGLSQEKYRASRDEIYDAVQKILRKMNQFISKEGNNRTIENKIKESEIMKIAIGSDHAGFFLKKEIIELLKSDGYELDDLGTMSDESVDYPDFAYKVASGVAEDKYNRGILICGTGIGMSISANKVPGVRAALCHNVYSARATRNHNDSNVLTMGSRVIGVDLAKEIVKTWLGADFDGGRHARRVAKLEKIERGDYNE